MKPIRVGEAGIFAGASWGEQEEPPLAEGWWEFLTSMPERNVHGLQTFHLADMDYRGFTDQVPGMLVRPLDVEVTWPSQSGADARIDPFSVGTPAARGSIGCVSTGAIRSSRSRARRRRRLGLRSCSAGSPGGMWGRWRTSDRQRCSCG